MYGSFGLLIFLFLLASSRYGRIQIKLDNKPEYSIFSWGSMLFAAGIGATVLYWSTVEWIDYYNILKNNPEILMSYKTFIKHILIDEFQDTSVLQWQNFMPLLENTVSTGKMNLLVGDAKQSIYKFRGGEVGLIASMTNQNSDLLGDKLGSNELDQFRYDYLLSNTENISLNNNFY